MIVLIPRVVCLQYLSMKVLENSAKIAEIQSRLNKYSYLSKTSLPGYADGRAFQILQSIKRYPDRSINPHFYHWYILMKQFSASTIGKWIADQLYYDGDDTLITQFFKLYTNKKDYTDTSNESEAKFNKPENPNEFQYTVDIYMNHWIAEKIKEFQNMLEEYRGEIIEIEEKQKSKCVRVLCRMEATRAQEMVNKISSYIEVGNIEIKKRSMKATVLLSQDKPLNEG